jgi:putative DNA primase/helicase
MDNGTTKSPKDFLNAPPSPPLTPALNPMADNGKVKIDIAIDHLPTLNALCWEAIGKCNEPPALFRFAGDWTRVVTDEQGFPKPQPISPEILRNELSQWADWHRNQISVAKPPLDVMKDVLATRQPPLPILRRMVSVPVFAPDGSLRLEPGYSVASGVLYAPRPGFVALPVPETVTAEQVTAARNYILQELITDFPFASDADRDNAVGLLLLPFARDLIDGATPCHLMDASAPGSGKTLLTDALLWAAIGMPAPILTEQRDDDNWSKVITAHLISGKQVATIDNVNKFVNSGSLAAALTATTWDGRVLGGSTLAGMPIRTIWVITGNNVTLSSEMIRRCVRIRLVPKTDHPEELDNFRHVDLRGWCKENQANLAQAAHIIIRWWLQIGRPRPEKLKLLGSYEQWTLTIGGILHSIGLTSFLTNYRDFQAAADTGKQALAEFCSTWYEWSQREDVEKRRRVKVSDLMPIAEKIEAIPLYGNTPRAQQTSLGRWLKSNVDMFVTHTEDGESGTPLTRSFRIQAAGILNGTTQWKIELIE